MVYLSHGGGAREREENQNVTNPARYMNQLNLEMSQLRFEIFFSFRPIVTLESLSALFLRVVWAVVAFVESLWKRLGRKILKTKLGHF